MTFGEDFFKTVQFIVAVLRLLARIFGDDKDKEDDDKIMGNHAHEVNDIIKTTNAAKTKQG